MADLQATSTLRVHGVSKRFGSTLAVDDASFAVAPGELIGIAGHNGAGKSTIMKLAIGELAADTGTVELAGSSRPATDVVPDRAATGVRLVHQELSLCPALRVDETAALFDRSVRGLSWRRSAWRRLETVLDEMFPGHGIHRSTPTGALSISRRQMVECACAMLPGQVPAVLAVLDEPTSSLDHEATASFYAYLRARAADGLAAIITTHRLHEMTEHLDRIYLMRDGRVIGEQDAGSATKESLVAAMGVGAHQAQAEHEAPHRAARVARTADERPTRVTITAGAGAPTGGVAAVEVSAGEIVGLGGLEGHGQFELLNTVYSTATGRRSAGRAGHLDVQVSGSAAFVSGDRGARGIFPLWDVRTNITVASLPAVSSRGTLSAASEADLVGAWWSRLGIKGAPTDPITSLSGGTQQKALMVRALALSADLLLLEDPTRGVDQSTKEDIYALLREQADRGTTVLWYSTENEELRQCDRVLVMRSGAVVDVLDGGELSEEAIIQTSFAGQDR